MSNKVIDAVKQAHNDYQRLKGGSGSGNHGHSGRPGKIGGSAGGGKGGGGSVPNWLEELPHVSDSATNAAPQGRNGKIKGGGAFDWEVNGENYSDKLTAVAEAGKDKRRMAKAIAKLGGAGDRRDGLDQLLKGLFGARYETTVNDREGSHDYYYRGPQEWRVNYNPGTDKTIVEYTKLS